MTLLSILLRLIIAVALVGTVQLLLLIRHRLLSPLRKLRGPASPSWLYGNLTEVDQADVPTLHESWAREFGPTLRYTTLFGENRLFTLDTRAMHHVMSHSAEYQKPSMMRRNLTATLGAGVLVTEGDQHKKQRRILNPAFGPAQIRALTDVFLAKAVCLRDIWAADMSANAPKRVDVLDWLSRATLDIIGLAGFNYNFDALTNSETPNELNKAFATIFYEDKKFSLLTFLQENVPLFSLIPSRRGRSRASAIKTMNRIGYQLLRDSKAAIVAEKRDKSERARDLLSLLVHANMDPNIPESQRLTDPAVVAQVPTFLVAGHETTSTATTWTFFALTQNPEVQKRLREELLAVDTDTPDMDTLMSLPYFDAVVREVLRLHAPVASTVRIATKDDIIPLAKPVIDRYGVAHDSIHISKGDSVLIPILAMNRDEAIWGPDALEFRPERWEKLPEAASTIPGIWGHLMTFLGGPRACIGYRFSLVEMKALLFPLVRAFEFELAVPGADISKKTAIVQRPLVLSDPERRNQMPILIRRVST